MAMGHAVADMVGACCGFLRGSEVTGGAREPSKLTLQLTSKSRSKFCLRQDIYPIYGYDREASASSASSCLSHIALYSSSDITSLSLRAVSIASGLARTL